MREGMTLNRASITLIQRQLLCDVQQSFWGWVEGEGDDVNRREFESWMMGAEIE